MLEEGKIRVSVREVVKVFGLWQTKLLGQETEQWAPVTPNRVGYKCINILLKLKAF